MACSAASELTPTAWRCCPSCLEASNRCLGEVAGTRIFRCSNCGLAFTDPVVASSYEHEEWYDWLRFTPETGEKYLRFQTGMFSRQLRVLSRYTDGRRLLDVGAGLGVFARVATSSGWRVTCVDLNPRARRFGKEVYGLSYQDFETVPENSMDVVRLSHVLEHIGSPNAFLALARTRLRERGICAVMVPHYEPLSCVVRNLIFKALPGEYDFRGHIYSPQHVLGFTRSSLTALFRRAGFAPLHVRSVSRGNRTYYPWVSDDVRLAARVVAYELVNKLGDVWGRGSWVVGYYRKVVT
jgi:SAM-dependent methyltransferase